MGPPPIPKRTPHPLSRNIKPSVIPNGKVWVQGKIRDKASKAAKHQQKTDERRAQRVLRRLDYGLSVYAYNHLRTNQVVYSLSRYLEEGQILPQLLYHGKKTKPPSIRKDLWTPYFSLHFPTPKHGLTAYRQLRELTYLRQSAPPESLITNTKASQLRFQPTAKYDPNHRSQKFPVGHIMPKQHRARVLMDQKATSVADVAFVLGLQNQIQPDSERVLEIPSEADSNFPRRLIKQEQRRRAVMAGLERQIDEEKVHMQEPVVPLSEHAQKRIAYEQKAVPNEHGGVTLPDEELTPETDVGSVRILWADVRDATYAKSWPATVSHGNLEPVAELRDETGDRKLWSSIHVIGNERDQEAAIERRNAQNARIDALAAEQDSAEREARRNERQNSTASLPNPSDLGASSSSPEGSVEPAPKPLSSRMADALMFWRRR